MRSRSAADSKLRKSVELRTVNVPPDLNERRGRSVLTSTRSMAFDLQGLRQPPRFQRTGLGRIHPRRPNF